MEVDARDHVVGPHAQREKRDRDGQQQGEDDNDGERSREADAADQGDERLQCVREQDTDQHRRDERSAFPHDVERGCAGHDRARRGTDIDSGDRAFSS